MSTQQAFIFNQGKYYVEYFPDEKVGFKGGRSRCMPYDVAKDYADIFGGTVHRDPDFPTILQRIKSWWA